MVNKQNHWGRKL